jgi:hypothetical protein
VVFAAGAVMVAVFFTFALSGPLQPKVMGVILGVAVRLDAALIRLVLLPVLLRLMRDATWSYPRWLVRLLPDIRFSIDPTNFACLEPKETRHALPRLHVHEARPRGPRRLRSADGRAGIGAGGSWWILAVAGLLPLATGVLNLCPISPIFGRSCRGNACQVR